MLYFLGIFVLLKYVFFVELKIFNMKRIKLFFRLLFLLRDKLFIKVLLGNPISVIVLVLLGVIFLMGEVALIYFIIPDTSWLFVKFFNVNSCFSSFVILYFINLILLGIDCFVFFRTRNEYFVD